MSERLPIRACWGGERVVLYESVDSEKTAEVLGTMVNGEHQSTIGA